MSVIEVSLILEEALAAKIGDYHALLPMLSNPVTQQVIKAGKNLKVIADHAVGYDDIRSCKEASKHARIKVRQHP
ncbi:MAG: hypothetical protein U5K69_04110 [Balneolaceae bacterium]|nr:hypothetical protein [Balneolaceae bacterium]